MSYEGPLNTSYHISRRVCVRALEDTPSTTTRSLVPQISPLGSVHMPIVDHYEGITDKQIMKITISCGVMLGSSRTAVADSLRMMDQVRASVVLWLLRQADCCCFG